MSYFFLLSSLKFPSSFSSLVPSSLPPSLLLPFFFTGLNPGSVHGKHKLYHELHPSPVSWSLPMLLHCASACSLCCRPHTGLYTVSPLSATNSSESFNVPGTGLNVGKKSAYGKVTGQSSFIARLSFSFIVF